MPRIALVWTADSSFPQIIAEGDVEVFSVDELYPNDRVYRMGPGVKRVSSIEFDVLVAGPVHEAGDKPIVEQAIRAKLAAGPSGKPNLSIVNPE